MKTKLAGLTGTSRELLGTLLRASQESFTVVEAAHILKMSRPKVASLLAMWARQGWLHRVRRGLYIPVSLQAPSPVATPEHPWLIAHKLFSPCYIGGWTAAHYWDLTEQLFSSVYVMTTKKVHQREQYLNGVNFKIKTVLSKKIFGTQFIWDEKVKVAVSDPTKTVIDSLNDPDVVGGIRMTTDILLAYIHSNEFDSTKLLEYARKMDNSVIFKRLGFLIELIQTKDRNLIMQTCRENLKSGYSQLDPSVPGDRLETKWHLWVPKFFNLEAKE